MIIKEKDIKESARDYALRILRENIIMMELKPGTLVSENKLAKLIGLSKTPVREALIELSKVKIVEIYPQKGSVISKISSSLVDEARFIRIVLESSVVELSAKNATEEYIIKLEENIKLQHYYLENGDNDKLLLLDDEFHQLIFESVNKLQTYELMQSMMVHFDRVRNLSLQTVKEIKIVEDHENILNSIRTKNPEEAVLFTKKHLNRYKLDEEAIFKIYGEYFTI